MENKFIISNGGEDVFLGCKPVGGYLSTVVLITIWDYREYRGPKFLLILSDVNEIDSRGPGNISEMMRFVYTKL
jgi:hypothetical protein